MQIDLRSCAPLSWVAVKELNLSYYDKETCLLYTHVWNNFVKVPEQQPSKSLHFFKCSYEGSYGRHSGLVREDQDTVRSYEDEFLNTQLQSKV